jgi:hypothetical protein
MTANAPERPLGLSILIWLFWFWAGAIILVLLGFMIGEGPVMMSGEAVSRREALSRIAPVFIPMGAAVLAAALGLSLGRRWARAAALLPFLLLAIAPSLVGGVERSPTDLVVAALVGIPLVAVLAWYLFVSRSVAAYYRAVTSARAAGVGDGTRAEAAAPEPPPPQPSTGESP